MSLLNEWIAAARAANVDLSKTGCKTAITEKWFKPLYGMEPSTNWLSCLAHQYGERNFMVLDEGPDFFRCMPDPFQRVNPGFQSYKMCMLPTFIQEPQWLQRELIQEALCL